MSVEHDHEKEREQLSERELQAMVLYSNPFLEKIEIADQLSITVGTLNSHIARAFLVLGETDRFTAAWRFQELYPEYGEEIRMAIVKSAGAGAGSSPG